MKLISMILLCCSAAGSRIVASLAPGGQVDISPHNFSASSSLNNGGGQSPVSAANTTIVEVLVQNLDLGEDKSTAFVVLPDDRSASFVQRNISFFSSTKQAGEKCQEEWGYVKPGLPYHSQDMGGVHSDVKQERTWTITTEARQVSVSGSDEERKFFSFNDANFTLKTTNTKNYAEVVGRTQSVEIQDGQPSSPSCESGGILRSMWESPLILKFAELSSIEVTGVNTFKKVCCSAV
mmetsp:Transcript_24433/g.42757  ORF Transcript_24433/g.42757 Transcript_24433/m.42757 type:complete len:236 (-) Transcript_24433:66-773(-)